MQEHKNSYGASGQSKNTVRLTVSDKTASTSGKTRQVLHATALTCIYSIEGHLISRSHSDLTKQSRCFGVGFGFLGAQYGRVTPTSQPALVPGCLLVLPYLPIARKRHLLIHSQSATQPTPSPFT